MTLPNFLVIGANKSATSSLHWYLSQHPDVFMSAVKEPMFFVREGRHEPPASASEAIVLADCVTDRESYERLFAGAAGARAVGESSTAYLANPWCAERIHALVPGMKLIASLREPVDRAFSNYRMYVKWRLEVRSFEQAVRDELEGRSGHLPQGQHYLELGLYGRQLTGFRRVFAEESMLLLTYDEIRHRARAALRRIFSFLAIDPGAKIDVSTRLNAHDRPQRLLERSRRWLRERLSGARAAGDAPLSRPTRDRLRAFYREDIGLLEELSGLDLTPWRC